MKRDEAKHEAEEREKKRKQQVVEGERRLKRLKAGEADGNQPPAAEHVNFFQVRYLYDSYEYEQYVFRRWCFLVCLQVVYR